jgi:hypothetical protein
VDSLGAFTSARKKSWSRRPSSHPALGKEVVHRQGVHLLFRSTFTAQSWSCLGIFHPSPSASPCPSGHRPQLAAVDGVSVSLHRRRCHNRTGFAVETGAPWFVLACGFALHGFLLNRVRNCANCANAYLGGARHVMIGFSQFPQCHSGLVWGLLPTGGLACRPEGQMSKAARETSQTSPARR